ncbi:HET-domain-containing protein, partial [Setomelanomma holmii]
IRVVELLPREQDAPVTCRLTECYGATFDDLEAFSYVWGAPVLTEPWLTVVTDAVISLTENLSHALQALRYQHQSRYLWVDAICINQLDTTEKSHQVQNIGRIYEHASTVIVWLG